MSVFARSPPPQGPSLYGQGHLENERPGRHLERAQRVLNELGLGGGQAYNDADATRMRIQREAREYKPAVAPPPWDDGWEKKHEYQPRRDWANHVHQFPDFFYHRLNEEIKAKGPNHWAVVRKNGEYVPYAHDAPEHVRADIKRYNQSRMAQKHSDPATLRAIQNNQTRPQGSNGLCGGWTACLI